MFDASEEQQWVASSLVERMADIVAVQQQLGFRVVTVKVAVRKSQEFYCCLLSREAH